VSSEISEKLRLQIKDFGEENLKGAAIKGGLALLSNARITLAGLVAHDSHRSAPQ